MALTLQAGAAAIQAVTPDADGDRCVDLSIQLPGSEAFDPRWHV